MYNRPVIKKSKARLAKPLKLLALNLKWFEMITILTTLHNIKGQTNPVLWFSCPSFSRQIFGLFFCCPQKSTTPLSDSNFDFVAT